MAAQDMKGNDTLSERGKGLRGPPMPYLADFFSALGNLYDAERNPAGKIVMAVAENRQSFSEVVKGKLEGCRELEDADGAYTNMTGTTRLREAWSSIGERWITNGVRVGMENVAISAGCGALLCQLSVCLCEEGDGVLVPTPRYGAFDNDVGAYGRAKVVDAPLDEFDMKICREALERAALEAEKEGIRPRMLILCNPNNPLGTVHSASEIREAIAWARSRDMHVIVDEVYALSTYGTEFVSAVQVMREDNVEEEDFLGNNVHVLWGMSKDFAMSGYRVGVLVSHNRALHDALGNIGYFHAVSNDTQHALADMLQDDDFVATFIDSVRSKLKSHVQDILDKCKHYNIPVPYSPTAGLFLWLDLRKLLPAGSAIDADHPENGIFRLLSDRHGVILTPGSACHAAHPGFFRCCYVWMDHDAVLTGIDRIGKALE